jgi:hypothetical protein
MTHRLVSTKSMLLPLPTDYVRQVSLVAHLALAVCRAGKGNSHQFYQLIRMTYHSYLLWKEGYGTAIYETFCDAERALELTAEHAYSTGEWVLKEDTVYLTQQVIRTFDTQLETVSRRQYLHSAANLDRLLRVEIPRKLAV